MSRLLPLLLMLGSCGGDGATSEAVTANKAEPEAAAPAIAEKRAAPLRKAAEAAIPDDDPGLAGMSPSRRRAYQHGFRDCSAGRYNPDPYPEAYRIGCGAAQERKEGGGR